MPQTLLLADDSITMQKVVAISLANQGVTVSAVDNGDAAVAKARELQPSLVIADTVMPGKDGYEVCRILKADPATRHIPVLLLSGTFEPFDEEKAKEVRADGHLIKPFESGVLLEKVLSLLAKDARPAPPPAPEPGSSRAAPPQRTVPAPSAPRPIPPPAGMGGRPLPPPPFGRSPFPPPPGPGGAKAPLPSAPIPVAPMAPPPGAPSLQKGRPQAPAPFPAASPGFAQPRPPAPAAAPQAPSRPQPPVPPQAPARPQPPAAPQAPGWPQPPAAPQAPGRPPSAAPQAPAMQQPPAAAPQAPAFSASRPQGRPIVPTQAPAPLPAPVAPEFDEPWADFSVVEEEVPFDDGADLLDGVDLAMTGFGEEGEGPASSILDRSTAAPSLELAADALAAVAAPAADPPREVVAPAPADDGGEADLRRALSQASREVIEKIAWEVVPQLAETILREQVQRYLQERDQKGA